MNYLGLLIITCNKYKYLVLLLNQTKNFPYGYCHNICASDICQQKNSFGGGRKMLMRHPAWFATWNSAHFHHEVKQCSYSHYTDPRSPDSLYRSEVKGWGESVSAICVGKNTRNYIQHFLTLVLFTFCACCILRSLVRIVVSFVYCWSSLVCIVVILCVFAVLVVYCCFYFRCRTAG